MTAIVHAARDGVSVSTPARSTYEYDCLCGWTSARLPFRNPEHARRASRLHRHVCPLLHR